MVNFSCLITIEREKLESASNIYQKFLTWSRVVIDFRVTGGNSAFGVFVPRILKVENFECLITMELKSPFLIKFTNQNEILNFDIYRGKPIF